jgi:large subunit ribosomal protein L4e
MSIKDTGIFDLLSIDGTILKNYRIDGINSTKIDINLVKNTFHCIKKSLVKLKNVKSTAGSETSARSWGTGRGISRVPRVRGSGTTRNGQGAVCNMCRGGRVFGVNRYRKNWCLDINRKIRVLSLHISLIATIIPTVIVSRGFIISDFISFPLILEDIVRFVWHPKELVIILKRVGGFSQLIRSFKISKSYKILSRSWSTVQICYFYF